MADQGSCKGNHDQAVFVTPAVKRDKGCRIRRMRCPMVVFYGHFQCHQQDLLSSPVFRSRHLLSLT